MGTCPIKFRSSHPILETPPEPVGEGLQESVIVSLHNYPSLGHTQLAMSMCIGERLTILSDDGDFIMVRSTTTGHEGYIPNTYTAKVTHRWLYTGISRLKAVELLLQPSNHNGAFLVRESETQRDCHSLSILRRTNSSYLDGVKHYRISRLQNGWVYISPGLTFPSLHHLVEHYSECADGLSSRLTAPCFIQGLSDPGEARPVPTAIRRPTINWKDISRSMLFKRKRTESDNSLVSEGLREAIISYLQMTEGNDHSWDT
ncbi:src-like-adapter 2 [Hippoglossus stenolepis]|uniref:src-like-adapter 2 n=1 Tax=Hippoglossus stenolepis TaxID=195615 RepID=UPI001FAF46B0|nr:src-like-adapter 2 [Hippoglossus stenolepis]XP_035007780.2 src-like-adapter 2 [Hippoglossus stenolepis]